jgi:hypothetical protein
MEEVKEKHYPYITKQKGGYYQAVRSGKPTLLKKEGGDNRVRYRSALTKSLGRAIYACDCIGELMGTPEKDLYITNKIFADKWFLIGKHQRQKIRRDFYKYEEYIPISNRVKEMLDIQRKEDGEWKDQRGYKGGGGGQWVSHQELFKHVDKSLQKELAEFEVSQLLEGGKPLPKARPSFNWAVANAQEKVDVVRERIEELGTVEKAAESLGVSIGQVRTYI